MARSSDPKKRSLWQGRFQRFLDSGLAVARFCAIEHVSESSFYYWQKKLGPQALRRPTRAENHDACAGNHDACAGNHDAGSEDRNVFQPVTVVPAVCGVLIRLPGGTQIEVGPEHLDVIRAVTAEVARGEHGDEVLRVEYGAKVTRSKRAGEVSRGDRSGEADRSSCSRCGADRQHGGAASC